MNSHAPHGTQLGLTLIENLVALLLLSFSLLGMAGLITQTLGRGKDSVSHSLAAMQAQDIADRMRANRKAYDIGNYFTYLGTASTQPASQGCSASGFGGTPTVADCTPDQMAQDDAYDWRQWVASSLPGGIAVVCHDDTPNDGLDSDPACDGGTRTAIKIFWRVSRGGGRASDGTHDQRFVMVFRP